MTIDRRSITIPRSWAWTVLMGCFVVVGILVMVGVALLRQGEDVAALVQAQRRADIRAEATTKQSAAAARERTAAAVGEVRRILEESIIAHDQQAQSDHDAQMGRLAMLLGRPTPTTAPRPATRPAPRPAPRTPATTVAPRVGGSPAAPPTTAARVTPTTVAPTTTCPTRGKSEKCR